MSNQSRVKMTMTEAMRYLTSPHRPPVTVNVNMCPQHCQSNLNQAPPVPQTSYYAPSCPYNPYSYAPLPTAFPAMIQTLFNAPSQASYANPIPSTSADSHQAPIVVPVTMVINTPQHPNCCGSSCRNTRCHCCKYLKNSCPSF